MTRKLLNTIRTDITTNLPDNTTGLITPAIMRTLLTDITDSTTQAIGAIEVSGISTAQGLSATATKIAGIFTTAFDDPELTADLVNSRVIGSTTAGWNYEGRMNLTFSAANNVVVEMRAYVNGSPTALVAVGTGRGTGNPLTISLSGFLTAGPANAFIEMFCTAPGGSTSITINAASIFVELLPTNS